MDPQLTIKVLITEYGMYFSIPSDRNENQSWQISCGYYHIYSETKNTIQQDDSLPTNFQTHQPILFQEFIMEEGGEYLTQHICCRCKGL